MYLKQLEINGFKTFADKTVIQFNPDLKITSIVGPNGCGKSNIFDAVRWVMGEQSLKSLRSQKSDEIIFNGSEEQKSISMAYVSMTIDNSDHSLPIDFPEVSIQRKVYRSGEGEYFINKTPCRLKDIHDLFMDTGIGKDSYFMISQGQVDALISTDPSERRVILEEAAGINKYKFRRNTAERKLDNTEQNLNRLLDLQQEITTRINPLADQAQKAEEYITIRKELKELEIGLYKEKIVNLLKEQKELQGKIFSIQAQLKSKDEDQRHLNTEMQAKRGAIQETDRQIEVKHGELQQINNTKEKVSRDIEMMIERIRHLQDRQIITRQDITNAESYLHEINNRIEKHLAEMNHVENHITVVEDEYQIKEVDNQRIIADWRNTLEQIESMRRTLFAREAELSGKRNDLIERRSRQKMVHDEISRQDIMQAKFALDIDNLQHKIEELTQAHGESQTLQEKLQSAYLNSESDLQNKRTILLNVIEQRSKYKEDFDIKSSRLSLLIEMQKGLEGYFKGVKNILLSKRSQEVEFEGVIGVIADILNVDARYENAIAAALGAKVQDIVTTSEHVAYRAMQYLADNDLGRATFLPLDQIKLPKEYIDMERIRALPGVIDSALLLVSFDPVYQNIITQLLHNIIVVRDLAAARQMLTCIQDFPGISRIVTLSGEVIYPMGAVSGGSVTQGSTNILVRHRQIVDLEQQVRILDESNRQLEGQEELIKQAITSLEAEIEHLRNDRYRYEIAETTIDIDIKGHLQKKQEILQEMTRINNDNSQLHHKLVELNQMIDQSESDYNSISRSQEEAAQQLKNMEVALNERERLREQSNESLTRLKIIRTELITKIEQFRRQMQSLEENKSMQILQVEAKQKEFADLGQHAEEFRHQKEQRATELPALDRYIYEKDQEIKTQHNVKQALYRDIEEIEKASKALFEADREVREQASTLEVQAAKVDAELEIIEERLHGEYEVSLEDIVNLNVQVEDYLQVERLVNKHKRRLKALEPVNLLAVDEYRALKERSDFLQTQVDDLDKAKRNLEKLVQELDILARSSLAETLKTVQQYFSQIFERLFNGGRARIDYPETEDILSCDIDIIAEPPGKKPASINQLSGGEKAMTGIALLFALLKTKPSPFIFLDEVDAPLDDANIGRFTEMLREFTQHTQVVVITHSKRTMSASDTMYGITMEKAGISRLVSVKLVES